MIISWHQNGDPEPQSGCPRNTWLGKRVVSSNPGSVDLKTQVSVLVYNALIIKSEKYCDFIGTVL